MSRGPRPHKALAEAIPIAKARGIIQLAGLIPERISRRGIRTVDLPVIRTICLNEDFSKCKKAYLNA